MMSTASGKWEKMGSKNAGKQLWKAASAVQLFIFFTFQPSLVTVILSPSFSHCIAFFSMTITVAAVAAAVWLLNIWCVCLFLLLLLLVWPVLVASNVALDKQTKQPWQLSRRLFRLFSRFLQFFSFLGSLSGKHNISNSNNDGQLNVI